MYVLYVFVLIRSKEIINYLEEKAIIYESSNYI